MNSKTVVFIHGWSVTNTDTYGELPRRLKLYAEQSGIDLRIEEIFLSKYISFRDEVQIKDISRAFDAAVEDQLSGLLKKGERFICITHSTGGPVIRDWLHRYFFNICPFEAIISKKREKCPLSHLIMLAPANHGSALAQLGKGRLSRIKTWFEGVEPGEGVLNWLELGSSEAFDLNMRWIVAGKENIKEFKIFPFVLTGQCIDRKLYDNLNAYTGELGSDGVVRIASANLNGLYVRMIQNKPKEVRKGVFAAKELSILPIKNAPLSAMRVISGKSHSGKDIGIMRSVKLSSEDNNSTELLKSIVSCLKVQSNDEYESLCKRFEEETVSVQKLEMLETIDGLFSFRRHFIHDRYTMVIFRITDSENNPVTDFDLMLTAGEDSDPNKLPQGFFADRQLNKISKNIVTFYLNYDIMAGTDEVKANSGKIIRDRLPGAQALGFRINARPDDGFVRYLPCEAKATPAMLQQVLRPNATTLIDVVLQRVVYKNVFRMEKLTDVTKTESFRKAKPGEEVV